MFRILIVDDERYVVEWVASLLENELEDEIDLCTAGSGLEALGWLNRSKIDLLITDIKMPIMDGLDLLQRVNSLWPQCKTILLTAHSDFTYARQAIGKNVLGYVLKTEDDDVILANVKQALALIRREYAGMQAIHETEQRIRDSIEILQEELLISLLRGLSRPADKVSASFTRLGIPLDMNGPTILVIGRIGLSESADLDAYLDHCALLSRKLLAHCANLMLVRYESKTPVWFLQEKPDHEQRSPDFAGARQFLSQIKGHFETLQAVDSGQSGLSLDLFICQDRAPLIELAAGFIELKIFTDRYNPLESGFVYSFYRAEARPQHQGAIWSDDLLRQAQVFRERIEGPSEAIEDFLCSQADALQQEAHTDLTFCQRYVLFMTLLYEYRKHVLQPGESDEYRAYIMSLSQDYLADPARAIQRALQTLAVTVGQKRTPLDPNATLMYKTIALVKKHVDQHLDEDISLSAISELTGYNASYLSRIFRQHEQQSYMGFVNQKRLERISRLMRQSEMNLDEIAHTAGFHSRTYFNRFINKMTGKSPSEYRQQVNLYRQDEGD